MWKTALLFSYGTFWFLNFFDSRISYESQVVHFPIHRDGGHFFSGSIWQVGLEWPWLYVNIQKFLTKALILLNFQLFSIGALGFFSGHCEGNGRNFVERMDRWSRQVAMGVRHAEALGRFWLDMHIFRGRKSDGFFGKKSGTVSSFTASCWSKFCSQTGIWIEGLFFLHRRCAESFHWSGLMVGWLDSFDSSIRGRKYIQGKEWPIEVLEKSLHRKFWNKSFFDKGTSNLWMSSIFGLFHPPERGFFSFGFRCSIRSKNHRQVARVAAHFDILRLPWGATIEAKDDTCETCDVSPGVAV